MAKPDKVGDESPIPCKTARRGPHWFKLFCLCPWSRKLASIQAARHIFGQVRVANDVRRGGIDEVNVPPDQFGKRDLQLAFGVIARAH